MFAGSENVAGRSGKMSRSSPLPPVERAAIVPMLPEQLNAILAVSRPEHRLAFLLGAYAGLRASEVRGLRAMRNAAP
jgi:hypothetical protein